MKANRRNKSDEGKRTGSASPHQRRGRRGMTRIDRKTGEPILSPKLTVDQLYAMANEPGWRPWMRLIAEHPHAWPELAEWWHTAQEQGFDTAGAAPLPPASMRGRRRVAIPSAPLPPEDEPGQEPVSAPAEQQAQASQSQSAPQRQTPSYSQGSSGSGSGSGRRPSSGGSSSSTNTGGASPGWSVPTPSDGGTGLPGSDPGL